MLQQWTAVNTAAITKVREDGGLVKFVPKDLLDIIWNYDMHKKDFVEKYYPKYFIPAKLFALNTLTPRTSGATRVVVGKMNEESFQS